MHRGWGCLGLVLWFAALGIAQQDPARKKDTQSPQAIPISGKQLFRSYCAMCHGEDATGDGPFAAQLKAWPPDLTRLAAGNNGVFPSLHVAEVIAGDFQKPSHGSKEMPMWGPLFRSIAHGRHDSAQRRIDNLVNYIESLQQK